MFIDVHCHLDMLKNLDKVVQKASEKNVCEIVSAGINPKNNRKVLELTEKYDIVKAALGVYPDEGVKMNEKEIDSEISFIRKNSKKVIAIGEIGMDFKISRKNEKKQRGVFEKFVRLGIELGKPVVVHSRKAELECIEILENLNAKKVVMHCFSGKKKLVKRIIENGWSLSIPANVKNSEHFRNVVDLAPIEQILCETDSPFLHPDKKFPNEPVNVVESYKMIAKIKNLNLREIEKQIEKNWEKLVN